MLNGYSQRKGFAETVRTLLGAAPCKIQVAALPWRLGDDGVEILLVTSRDTGRWVVPKGWPERGEALCDAAAREAREEAGIGGAISQVELGFYHYTKQRASGSEKACQVHVFPMEIDRIRERWPERKERKRAWFSPEAAAGHVREPELAELILGFGREPRRPLLPSKKAKRAAIAANDQGHAAGLTKVSLAASS